MRPRKERVTRLDYCQYLLVSQINYTLTHYADHTEQFSHDMANRYLAGDEVRPRSVWDNVGGEVIRTSYGFLIFDDTVLDKRFTLICLILPSFSAITFSLSSSIRSGLVMSAKLNLTNSSTE